jgi:hypothetical protein
VLRRESSPVAIAGALLQIPIGKQIEKPPAPLKLRTALFEVTRETYNGSTQARRNSMIKRIATSLAVLAIAAACSSTPMTSSETGGGTNSGFSVVKLSNAPHYISLSAPTQVGDWDFSNSLGVRGFHVRGTMTNRGFIVAGPVQGKGQFCADGKDWYSLTELKVYRAGEKAPVAPYITGCATDKGFQPASRDIVTQ